MEIISWTANVLAIIGWIVNIEHRKQAMMIFTIATVLSIIYFWSSNQMPFLYRFLFYLVIDIVTLWNIYRKEKLGEKGS